MQPQSMMSNLAMANGTRSARVGEAPGRSPPAPPRESRSRRGGGSASGGGRTGGGPTGPNKGKTPDPPDDAPPPTRRIGDGPGGKGRGKSENKNEKADRSHEGNSRGHGEKRGGRKSGSRNPRDDRRSDNSCHSRGGSRSRGNLGGNGRGHPRNEYKKAGDLSDEDHRRGGRSSGRTCKSDSWHRHDDHLSVKYTSGRHGSRDRNRTSENTKEARSKGSRHGHYDWEGRSPPPPIQSVDARSCYDDLSRRSARSFVHDSGADDFYDSRRRRSAGSADAWHDDGDRRRTRSSGHDAKAHGKNGRGSSHSSSSHATHCSHSHRSEQFTDDPRDSANRTESYNNDFPLHNMEEQQYEECQEQLYQQSQSQLSLQQHRQKQQQQHFLSTHRQFNLAPLYEDVEMAEEDRRRERGGAMQNQKRKNKTEKDMRSGKSHSPRGDDSTIESMPENNGIFAFLESSFIDRSHMDGSDMDGSDMDGSHMAGSYMNGSLQEGKRHEEFYNYDEEEDQEDDDNVDDDDDEERPLRRSNTLNRLRIHRPPPKSVLGWSEKCLNRSLVLVFFYGSFLFIRNRTSWWKAHQQRITMQKHHHHHNIDNSDDDDLKTKSDLDPMSVYNPSDDDSTHTRDHDPLGQYVEYTRDKGLDLRGSPPKNPRAPDPNSQYGKVTAGKRISDRGAAKSLHHGFMDEDYADRPEAENSGSNAAELAGVRDESKTIDEEEAAFLESAMRSPTKKKLGGSSASYPAEEGSVEGEGTSEEGESDGGQRIASQPLPPPAEDEAPVQGSTGSEMETGWGENGASVPTQSTSEAPMQSAPMQLAPMQPVQVSTGADTGVGEGDSNDGQAVSSHPLSLSVNDDLPTQSTTGSEMGDNSIEPSLEHPGEPSSSHPLSTIGQTPLESSTRSEAGSISDESSQKPMELDESEKDPFTDDASYTMLDDWNENEIGSDLKEVPTGGSMPRANEENSLLTPTSQLSSEVSDLSSTQQALSGSSGEASNKSVTSTNSQTSQTKEISKLSPSSDMTPIVNQALNGEEIKAMYDDAYYRWNHAFRPVTPSDTGKDVPVFWRIPRSASGTIETVLSFCYRNVLASSMGTLAGHDKDQVRLNDNYCFQD